MIGLLLLLLQASSGTWTTIWYVRLTYEATPSTWSTTGISADDFLSRASAEARRDDILLHGWAMPALIPGPGEDERGETRVAPGAIRYASVKRMLCRLDLPPQDRPPCLYPDGDPPTEP